MPATALRMHRQFNGTFQNKTRVWFSWRRHTEKEKCHGNLRFCGNCDFSGSFPGEQEQNQLSAILTVGWKAKKIDPDCHMPCPFHPPWLRPHSHLWQDLLTLESPKRKAGRCLNYRGKGGGGEEWTSWRLQFPYLCFYADRGRNASTWARSNWRK